MRCLGGRVQFYSEASQLLEEMMAVPCVAHFTTADTFAMLFSAPGTTDPSSAFELFAPAGGALEVEVDEAQTFSTTADAQAHYLEM